MFWSRGHSIRTGLMLAVALSCLAAASPVFGAARGHSNRDRVSGQKRNAERERPGRTAAEARRPSENRVSAQPARERLQGHLHRAAPSPRSLPGEQSNREASPRVWQRPRQLQPSQRPNLYRVYRAPERGAEAGPSQRMLHSQPATPLVGPRAERPGTVQPPVRVRVDRSTSSLWQRTPRARPDPSQTEQPKINRERLRDRSRERDRSAGPGRADLNEPAAIGREEVHGAAGRVPRSRGGARSQDRAPGGTPAGSAPAPEVDPGAQSRLGATGPPAPLA